jgi:hypothetical protein
VITVGELVCVLYGKALEWSNQQQKSGQAKPRKPSQAREWAEGSIATPCGKKASLSREWGGGGPIHMVLLRLVAQVCM